MHCKYLTLTLVGVASAMPAPKLKLPVLDSENLPDLTNTGDAVGVHDLPIKRQLNAPGLDAITKFAGNLPLPIKRSGIFPKLPFLKGADLPNIDNTLSAVGIKPAKKHQSRQLPSLPLIDGGSLPDLASATDSLGLDHEMSEKRQLPDLPLVDESFLPDLGGAEESLLPAERRGLVPTVPVVDDEDLPSVDRTVGAFGIASTDRERRRRQLRDTDVPVLDESRLPDITSTEKALGLWEEKRQIPETSKFTIDRTRSCSDLIHRDPFC
jgi:hypothetical protein